MFLKNRIVLHNSYQNFIFILFNIRLNQSEKKKERKTGATLALDHLQA
jgi:hypothetical protein